MSRPDFKPKRYDSAIVLVALEGGFTFRFDVGDWEDDSVSNLSDSEAFGMADNLARSGVELFGTMMPPAPPVQGLSATNGITGWTMLDTARIVAVVIEPTGIKANA